MRRDSWTNGTDYPNSGMHIFNVDKKAQDVDDRAVVEPCVTFRLRECGQSLPQFDQAFQINLGNDGFGFDEL